MSDLATAGPGGRRLPITTPCTLPLRAPPVCDEWMPLLELKLSPAEFHQLPRNAAYKYEYHDNRAWINPRPRYYHAMLQLPGLVLEGVADVTTRPMGDQDWEALVEPFAESFATQQPFTGQQPAMRLVAARRSLLQTRDGGDGPWIEQASVVATSDAGQIIGAIILTLLPPGDPTSWDTYSWDVPPPHDAIARCLGQPHLTWVFVRPEAAGRGVGTALLLAAATQLMPLGYTELLSTILLGNESSMLWHWRAGFRLLTYPGSPRRVPAGEP